METENDSLGSEYIERYITLRKYQKIGVIHRTGTIVTISKQMEMFPNPNDADKKPIERDRQENKVSDGESFIHEVLRDVPKSIYS